MSIFGVTMKFFKNILAALFLIGLVASCAKEEIIPAGNNDVPMNKKDGDGGVHISIDKGDYKGGNGDGRGLGDDDNDIDLNGDGDITDPENDLDFD